MTNLTQAKLTLEKHLPYLGQQGYAHLVAALRVVLAENETLWKYREIMEDAHGSGLWASVGILSHFDADGNILGNGQWRLHELWKYAKEFSDANERAAKLFDALPQPRKDGEP